MVDTSYAIALGSNRRHGRHGPPERVIDAAVLAMSEEGLRIGAISPVMRTPALGAAGRSFANTVAIIATPLDPPALLRLLKAIERRFTRRSGRRWGPRVIDLDIILWSGGDWPRFPARAAPGRLAVPHRAMAARDFVLTPLVAVAPDWRDPRSGLSVRHLRARLMRPSPVDRAARRQ